MRARRLPEDFAVAIGQVRNADAHIQTVVCWGELDHRHPLLVVPAPIVVPSLADRRDDLPRIIDEYAADAIEELRVPQDAFPEADRAWVAARAGWSFEQIEKATLRLVAIRASRSLSSAAARLDMAPISLLRWFENRQPPAPTENSPILALPLRRRSAKGQPLAPGAAHAVAPMFTAVAGGDR